MPRPIQVLIVDDEALGRERIRQLLTDHLDVHVVGECENGLQAVEAIEQKSPDLVFLDVQMPELDGVGVLNMLGVERVPEVIFTTAHVEYMERAFEAHAIDFLRKPFRESRFQDALHHAKQRIHARRALPPEDDPRIRAFLEQVTRERTIGRLKISEKVVRYGSFRPMRFSALRRTRITFRCTRGRKLFHRERRCRAWERLSTPRYSSGSTGRTSSIQPAFAG